ncbi:Protein transport protein SEC24 [Dissostichus eleginoides]|uniref:Protein transport protein SEC24 n=1 Tax=Dissostichus eleginoides TaxID=100907 RepID=A0AAD9F868_DISEL|nr:Protein transport protein SEC24 [Dissostichus eleginoides]
MDSGSIRVITGLIFNSQASVSCFAEECERRIGTIVADVLEPQRNEKEGNMETETARECLFSKLEYCCSGWSDAFWDWRGLLTQAQSGSITQISE